MSILFRRSQPAEQRAITSLPWSHGGDSPLSSTTASALAVVPVFAACRIISDSIATLPLQAFRKAGETRQPRELPTVFAKETRIEWVQQALMSLLLHGNAYGLVAARERDTTPSVVTWLNPEHMQIDESGARPVFRYNGREIDPNDIKHIPAYAIPGTIKGVSPIGACSLLADTGNSVQKMMRDWFNGRAVPGLSLQNTMQTLDAKEAEAVSARVKARMRNGEPFVHGKDWDLTVLSMPANDAGFIASAKLNATQVAAIYGVSPEDIGGETGSSLTYSTVELNQIKTAATTLRPWVAKLEQEFDGWLIPGDFVRFNIDASIRVDTKTRYEVHEIARDIGLSSVDELRALEDQAPLPNGQGQDYTPLKKSGSAPKETR